MGINHFSGRLTHDCRHLYLPAAMSIMCPWAISAQETGVKAQKPNVVIIMTDQQRADLCGREGFPVDLTPFADRMAEEGAWFNKAYTPCPASGPARVSLLTGRFPRVTHSDSNHNIADAVYSEDLFDVARKCGYTSVLVGKNHSHVKKTDVDWWIPYSHLGQDCPASEKTPENRAFDRFLGNTSFFTELEPAPGTVENQMPYRMVSDALEWVSGHKDEPFVMWLSFNEPHNPYQVCEPYWSMFDGRIPPALTDSTCLDIKGEKYRHLFEMMNIGHRGCKENLERIRSNYMGQIRLLDDQMSRFVEGMKDMDMYSNTMFVIISDHGDYAGEYGLMKKGAGVAESITRVPMVWFGNGVAKNGLREDCVSLVDIFPTICEAIGAEIPVGVQGRSLVEMLAGREYPEEEFRSIISEAGFGGEYITKEDMSDYRAEGAVGKGLFFDELNTWSQSGMVSMVRMGKWKFAMDMLGNCELYNLEKDPSEIDNLYGKKRYIKVQDELMHELLKWEIAINDPIPVPRNRYRFKRFPHNYLFSF
ncbi:MAG: sulfatase-like hydrolase/transferase [Bacteroides sp.]|nr:sulfatase-like hydrolase/transferase [Bacteroides sp.]